MNEELNIKIKVDTSAITPAVNKLKNEVSNVNKTLGGFKTSGLNKSMAATTASSKQLSQSIDKIQTTVKNISSGIGGWDFVKAITGAKLLGKAFDKILSSLDGGNGFLSNAIESFNPNSDIMDWEGMDAAWNNFNISIIEGFDQVRINIANAFTDMARYVKKIPLPKELDSFFSKLNDTISPKMAIVANGIEKAVKRVFNTLRKVKNFKMPSINDITNSFVKMGKSIKDIGPNMRNFGAGVFSSMSKGLNSFSLKATASRAAIAASGAALTGLTIAAGVFSGVGISAALSVSKLGKEIVNSANRFGFSTKAFQEWSYIMEKSGSTVENLRDLLENLNSEQGEVITGSEDAAQNFRNLGISAEEAVSMDSQTLFETVIARLQGIEDATLRSGYAYELFGDQASRLMNIINMSSSEMGAMINQYHLLGGAMSGELIESSSRLQGSIAGMRQAWQGISNTMAAVFIPVVQAVVNWITKAFVVVNLFLKSIFGLDLKSTAKGTEKAATSAGKYTGGLKAATKAAEQLKRTTMGFDELNIVQNPNKGGGSADTGSNSAGFGGDMPSVDDSLLNMDNLNLDSMYAWFEKYKGLIAQITTWSLIVIGVILAVIGAFSMNVPLFILGASLAGLGITMGFKSEAFFETWNYLQVVIQAVCEAIGLDVETTTQIIAKAFEVVWIVIQGIFDVMVATIGVVWETIKGVVSVGLAFIIGLLQTTWAFISAGLNIGLAFFDLICSLIGGIFVVLGNLITGNFEGAWKAVSKVWDKAIDFFKAIWDGIAKIFSSVVNWFGNTFAAAWNAITKVFNKAGDFFKGIWNTIKGIFTSIGGATGEAVSKAFSSAINWILDRAASIINGFVSAINGAIGIINKIPGVEIRRLSRIEVPRLAEGGIATRSVLANIGEAGKEAVLPLEYNTEWMDTLADKIAARNGGPTKVVLKVGEKELGWATIDSINSITKQTGAIQLTL